MVTDEPVEPAAAGERCGITRRWPRIASNGRSAGDGPAEASACVVDSSRPFASPEHEQPPDCQQAERRRFRDGLQLNLVNSNLAATDARAVDAERRMRQRTEVEHIAGERAVASAVGDLQPRRRVA